MTGYELVEGLPKFIKTKEIEGVPHIDIDTFYLYQNIVNKAAAQIEILRHERDGYEALYMHIKEELNHLKNELIDN